METIHLDTHVIVWLFQKDLSKFSKQSLKLINDNELQISPMVVMELKFLNEMGRLNYKPMEIITELTKAIALNVSDEKFATTAYESLELSWTRDPFDRLIVASASAQKAKLISKDRNILDHYEYAIW
jgi:PIN domain nuclease of toxin-antitoxin system